MIIHDLHLVCIALAEFETYPPGAIDRHCPLALAIALQLVQADAFQRAQVVKGLGNIEGQKQIHRRIKIEATKAVGRRTLPNLAAC